MNIKDTQNNRNSTSLFFLFFKQNFIFIVRYTMKLLLEFANKVRSLFYPFTAGFGKKKERKKRERNYCNDGNDDSIQIFISSPAFQWESNVS